MSDDTLFARAKRATDCAALLGVPSRAGWTSLKGKAHPCPACAGFKCFSFTRSGWRCHRSGEHGSVLDLAALIWSCDVFDAACLILKLDPAEERKRAGRDLNARAPTPRLSSPRFAPAPGNVIDANIQDVITLIKARLTPGESSPVARYFESRALPGAFARLVSFCADAPYDVGALWGRGRSFPAMIVEIEVDGRKTGGLHVTYLRSDGAGKVDTLREGEPAKKMWGPQKLGRELGGLMLMRPSGPAQLLCVAEGIENALAAACVAGLQEDWTHGSQIGAFAAGSLDRFQGGLALDRWGRTDWRAPAPDPDKPAATIRHRGPVLLCIDADMKPLVLQPNTQWVRVIAPERRAQVSAMLAAHWWKRAGASDVRVLTPPAGKDANDVLREIAA